MICASPPPETERRSLWVMTRQWALTPIARLAAAATMLIALPGAQAPEPNPREQASDSITVTGNRLSPQEAREQATAFIRQTGVARGDIPAARWVIPVCPKVLGLSEAATLAAEARLRAIAREADVKLAGERCTANMIVRFSSDPLATIQDIERRAPRQFTEVPRDERELLVAEPAPVRWWYSTEVLGRYGQRARNLPPPRSGADGATGSPGGSAIPDIPTVMHYQSSQISTLAQRSLKSAGIVIDAASVAGMSMDSVMAFAAMVGFAEIRDSQAQPDGSILRLFEATSPPRDLTAQDRAFLRALYRIPLDRPAIRNRGSLVREMTIALARDE